MFLYTISDNVSTEWERLIKHFERCPKNEDTNDANYCSSSVFLFREAYTSIFIFWIECVYNILLKDVDIHVYVSENGSK
jgi:hypothetical protein